MNEEDHRKWDLGDRLLEFATRIIRLVAALPDNAVGKHVKGQVIMEVVLLRWPIMQKQELLNLEKILFTQ